jgi:uncharacterized protein (TIGR00369 family)
LPPICALVGFEPAEVEEGRVIFECTLTKCHYNPIGAVHGGLPCTLFDSAMGCAVHTMLPAGVGYTTVELKVNFLRPITLRTGRLLCEGTTIHVGGYIAAAEARLPDTATAVSTAKETTRMPSTVVLTAGLTLFSCSPFYYRLIAGMMKCLRP